VSFLFVLEDVLDLKNQMQRGQALPSTIGQMRTYILPVPPTRKGTPSGVPFLVIRLLLKNAVMHDIIIK
jgi:hypothetical protein